MRGTGGRYDVEEGQQLFGEPVHSIHKALLSDRKRRAVCGHTMAVKVVLNTTTGVIADHYRSLSTCLLIRRLSSDCLLIWTAKTPKCLWVGIRCHSENVISGQWKSFVTFDAESVVSGKRCETLGIRLTENIFDFFCVRCYRLTLVMAKHSTLCTRITNF